MELAPTMNVSIRRADGRLMLDASDGEVDPESVASPGDWL